MGTHQIEGYHSMGEVSAPVPEKDHFERLLRSWLLMLTNDDPNVFLCSSARWCV